MADLLQPVAELLSQFELNLLTPVAVPGEFSGNGNLPNFRFIDGGPLYGLVATAIVAPPGLGRTAALEPWYFETLLKLSFKGLTRDTAEHTTSVVEVHTAHELVRFFNGSLTRCQFEILSGCVFTFRYLRLSAEPVQG